MKSKYLLLLIIPVLLVSHRAFAVSESEKARAVAEVQKALVPAQPQEVEATPTREVTGLEWLQMSMGKRMETILAAMYVLNHEGVRLSQEPDDYYNAVQERLTGNPELYTSYITNILANYIYETEPASRPVLDKFKRKPEIIKVETP